MLEILIATALWCQSAGNAQAVKTCRRVMVACLEVAKNDDEKLKCARDANPVQ